jgi:hypothetical protein
MKTVIFVAILCLGTVNLIAQPKDSPAKNETPAAQSTPMPTPSNNDHKPADQTERAKSDPPHWYTSSEWWLVLIAALTGAAIASQAREMARTTKVMDRQLGLQTAAMRQWVDITGWIASGRQRVDGTKELTISYEVSNPTSWPLVIEKTEMQSRGLVSTSIQRTQINPHNTHRRHVHFDSEEIDGEYTAKGDIDLHITLRIWFTDAMDKPNTQLLDGLLLAGKNEAGDDDCMFMAQSIMPPSKNTDQKED